MTGSPFTRRMFLRGLSTTLAIPFLPSLAPCRASAQAIEPQARFVFMGHYYGRDISVWYPKTEPTAMSPEGVRYASLADMPGEISHAFGSAFDPVRKKMSILRGLDSMDFDNAHQFSQPLTAGGTQGLPTFGYSLDAILEESSKFNRTLTKVGALRTSASTKENSLSFSFTSKSSYGQKIPTDWNPTTVYDKYFNAVTIEAAKGSIARKQAVSNRVFEDFKSVISNKRISHADQSRLDNYMTLLTSVEARLGLTLPACKSPAFGELMSAESVHASMIDMEVAALACGLTNVVVHGINHFSSDPAATDEAHHTAAHQNEALGSNTEKDVSQHATYDRWVMTRVAEMLVKLDGTDDGNGKTLLDNTFFLYGNTDARGYHVFYDMPVLVAGGQGKLALGQYIDFRPQPFTRVDPVNPDPVAGRPYNNLLVTLLKGLGLGEADYQKFNKVGFGSYGNFDQKLKSHYDPFLKPSELNAPLPFLYRG
jgi:hypothetical protein